MDEPAERIDERLKAHGDTLARFVEDWLHRFGTGRGPTYRELVGALVEALAANPSALAALQQKHYSEQLALWMRLVNDGPAEPADRATEADPRFRAPEWTRLAWFDFLRLSYLARSRWLTELVEALQVAAPLKAKLRFYIRQFVDAMAPSNSALTNPQAIRLALETRGASLAAGLQNMRDDLERRSISMSDAAAFEVGVNLAVTQGAVVFENDLMQLLQYRPLTPTVRRYPLVIVPPCINKYYILDLQPRNSFVRYAVEHGLTVFMISWRNVPAAMGRTRWDDYLERGVITAIRIAREITGAPKVNALGFCVGGTLLAAALAVLRRKRRRPAASLTLLATMLDFADPGEIGVYVDEAYVRDCDERLSEGGIVAASQLAGAFASLRANDLVWRYVENNYLLGRQPPAFDLLHWNADSTNLPGAMYGYYVRHMYYENALKDPDRLTMCGVPVDLGRIALPTYALAAQDDHIVPWRTAHRSAALLGERVQFVLAASGHIAGVINPPAQGKRSYRTGAWHPAADAWRQASAEHPGSWWPHWRAWISSHAGDEVAATPEPGNAAYPPIEPAPGRYVRIQPEEP